jgi:hypothetical protein
LYERESFWKTEKKVDLLEHLKKKNQKRTIITKNEDVSICWKRNIFVLGGVE